MLYEFRHRAPILAECQLEMVDSNITTKLSGELSDLLGTFVTLYP